ncbi:hypothetical protein SGFS_077130 [Streptomyces graminofaciens]|uniref:Uncharacterized protein n=1 Tax=Streptomyces graminofaciens TaxID=68212 RepID=A0ABN5VT03_9ACTN|nr:hypothetical protein SGFS_077130 [Streptomyces graminofaciens]
MQSSIAATDTCVQTERVLLRRRVMSSAPPVTRQTVATPAVHPVEASSISAAVPHAANAGGTSRRSVGPSCLGFATPSRDAEAACTAGRGEWVLMTSGAA